jgi:radical SAM protein with 4Fe4S-binding SPASM domain
MPAGTGAQGAAQAHAGEQPRAMDLQSFAEQVVAGTREVVYIRPADGLLIIRPNRLHHLNETAVFMLDRLYAPPERPDVDAVIAEVSERYGASPDRVRADLLTLLQGLISVLDDNIMGVPGVKVMPFGSHRRSLPVLSEIALTYRCNNRCTFCYANAPNRGHAQDEMTTGEVRTVINRIADEAHCPTLSFTGGEPTLREDLPELVRYAASKGVRVNLITNGVRCGEASYAQSLAGAGLDSAQVSIEGGSAGVHDAITQHPGSWALATEGVRHLRAAGVHTHTNTTLCGGNREYLDDLVHYLAEGLHSPYFSMNMVIRTGTALDHAEDDMRYSDVGPVIRAVQAHAQDHGIEFIWYSPVPYCLFNPVQAGLGSKSCACVDGLVSVSPTGQLLPCSSFERGIGDLLHDPFETVWNSRVARYWRLKEFIPPVCERCEIRHICCGACPLYWDQRGGFDELEGVAPGGSTTGRLAWHARRLMHSGTYGVGLGPRR